MLTYKLILPAALVVASSASADLFVTQYNDDQYDQGPAFVDNLDLTTMDVSNDLENVYFRIQTSSYESWTRYLVFLDTAEGTWISGNNNPWIRNVDTGSFGIDYFVGAYNNDSDNGGAALLYDGTSGSWNGIGGADHQDSSTHSYSIAFQISMASIGVGIGDTFLFEVATTGGSDGDPATDLMNGNSASWGGTASFGNRMLEYTIVPAPGALSLLAMAGLVARRRRA